MTLDALAMALAARVSRGLVLCQVPKLSHLMARPHKMPDRWNASPGNLCRVAPSKYLAIWWIVSVRGSSFIVRGVK
jgi:hypothetical protein